MNIEIEEDRKQLIEGIKRNDIDLVAEILRDLNPNFMNKSKLSPLYYAIKNGHDEIFNLLIEHGANIDYQFGDKNTAIYYAIEYNRENMLRLLIFLGADVNHQNQYGESPLFFVKTPEIVDLLIEAGADINLENKIGHNAIFNAVIYSLDSGDLELVKSFITHGSNLDLQDEEDGSTVLHYAYEEMDIAMIDLLIDSGADPRIMNFDGNHIFHDDPVRYQGYLARYVMRKFFGEKEFISMGM